MHETSNALHREGLHVVLPAPETPLRKALRGALHDTPNVTVTDHSLLEQDVDAIVSPANSFGWMDGGLELQLLERYGMQLQQHVRAHLRRDWGGELPVGMATSLPLPHPGPTTLVIAPTMRVPMRLPADTVNPYLAVRAALRLALGRTPATMGAPIRSIALPGMGTGVGGVTPEVFARQVTAAIDSLDADPPDDWWTGTRSHQLLSGVVVRDLQDEQPPPPVDARVSGHVVEDTITPLGDRLHAVLTHSQSQLVGLLTIDDGWSCRTVRVEVEVDPARARQLLASLRIRFHGEGERLIEHLVGLPGARRTASTQP